MTHIDLQRLSGTDSDYSNPVAHNMLDTSARGVEAMDKSFPTNSAATTLGHLKGSGGPGSDNTATASHDASEEDEFGQVYSEHKEDLDCDQGGSNRSNSSRLLLAVTVQQSSSSLPLYTTNSPSRGIPSAASPSDEAPVSIPTIYPSGSFGDEAEDDVGSSNTQDDAAVTSSLLESLSASVPQAPEHGLPPMAATKEEEKTEEAADLVHMRSLSSSSSSSHHQGMQMSSTISSSSHSHQITATYPPPSSPCSVLSNRSGRSTSSRSPPTSPETNPSSPSAATSASSPQANQPTSSTRLLRRSKQNGPPPISLAQRQDSDNSWDLEADDGLTDMPAVTLDASAKTNGRDHSANNCPLSKKLSLNSKRSVVFSHVHIRNYNVCIGDNPYCSYGPPLSLDWDYQDDPKGDIPLDVYEQHYQLPKQAQRRRAHRGLVLTYTERRARLWRSGFSLDEIDKVSEELEREKWRQSMLGNLEPLYRVQELWVLHVKPILSSKAKRRRDLDQQLEHVERQVREEHSQSMEFTSLSRKGSSGDLFGDEQSAMDPEKQASSTKAVLIEGIANLMDNDPKQPRELQSPTADNTGDDTHNVNNSVYGIRVDKKQHDKATEIILCSMERPHMRAFHGSWFSFLLAFFCWFSVAPLLSEVQRSLDLSKTDVWMSSLFATAGTIVFRLLMGPACDVWGARVCMSFILAAAAIPTALTGLVQTSAGLSLVRLFIGLAGSSFVACQYWTSEMFTRETAGTANALVAGWGNFGGGVANLVMGSALFPLFRWFYGGEDEDGDDSDSSELAWRTICIVPAILALVTAVLILFYCDDSPTGSYQDRIKNESLLLADPKEAFQKAIKNRNVWILTFQYACCFGVEVTMTNATALYFKDEFGQSTVSAAGIASVFGTMNLFARGLGGFWSDKFQNMHGVKGRLFWQMLTLILEGAGVAIFGFADSLAGSIIALIFLSCMVQSAEGSTFGIVPYVDRRFTGSVVGIVGSGGNFGAAIFAAFFAYFSYTTAFFMMGLCAIASSFLSFFVNTEKLAQTHDAVALEVEQRKQREEEAKKQGDGTNGGSEKATNSLSQNLVKGLNDEAANGETCNVAGDQA